MTLLAAFNFDEASGNVLDVTGNGHNFAISGNTVRTASGHTNGGLTQTATATAPGPSPSAFNTTSRTWMCWIKFAAAVNGWILEFHVTSANTGAWGLLDISGTLRFRAKDAANNVYESTSINRNLGTWQHIAATHDGANLKLYINGVLQSTTPMAAAVWAADVLNVLDQTGTNVILDDVRFYDQALDAATITTLMGTPVAASASFTGSVALSGTGALAATGKPAIAATAALSGTGTVAGGGAPALKASLGLSGAGAVAAAGTPSTAGSVALAGSGTAAGTGVPSTADVVALTGNGNTGLAGTAGIAGDLALSGSGTLTGIGAAQMPGDGSITLSGSGTLALAGTPAVLSAAQLAGNGLLAATATPDLNGALALAGGGTFTAAEYTPGETVHESVLTATNAPSAVLTASNHPSSSLEASHGV